MVTLEESLPGSSSWLMRNITLYNLYVWLHQYATKDTGVIGPSNTVDYTFIRFYICIYSAIIFRYRLKYIVTYMHTCMQFYLFSGADPGFSEGGSESGVDLEGWG